MDESLKAGIVSQWRLSPPLRVEPLQTGTNNRSYLVTTDTDSYILKWYRNILDLRSLRFEHALLNALATANLPFAVPALVPTVLGATYANVSRGADIYRLALFRRIAGDHAVFGDLVASSRCGAALATLDEALKHLHLDHSVILPEAFGSLASIHVLVPEPLEAIGRFSGSGDIVRLVSDIEEQWHRATATWERQIIHGDFYPSNTLMVEGQVSGVLDFEFSGLGYRIMEFAIGLAAFSVRDWERGASWNLVESFAEGYLRRSPFTEEELVTVPVMMLMREASSLVHWIGRAEQGLTPRTDIHSRLSRFMALHRWLELNEGQLLDRLGRIAT